MVCGSSTCHVRLIHVGAWQCSCMLASETAVDTRASPQEDEEFLAEHLPPSQPHLSSVWRRGRARPDRRLAGRPLVPPFVVGGQGWMPGGEGGHCTLPRFPRRHTVLFRCSFGSFPPPDPRVARVPPRVRFAMPRRASPPPPSSSSPSALPSPSRWDRARPTFEPDSFRVCSFQAFPIEPGSCRGQTTVSVPSQPLVIVLWSSFRSCRDEASHAHAACKATRPT